MIVRFLLATGTGKPAEQGPLKSMRVAEHWILVEVESTRALPCAKHPAVAAPHNAPAPGTTGLVAMGPAGTPPGTTHGSPKPPDGSV
jgi:hypothetical protein